MKRILVLAGLISAAIFSCKKSGNDDNVDSFNRQRILVNMADSLIIPSYQDFQAKADAMVSKVKAFTENPGTTSLTEARTAWKNAYVSWQKVALWNIGPAMEQNFLSSANTYPTNTTAIEGILGGATYDLSSPFSKDIQGFPAIEYLLYGNGSTDAEIVSSFANSTKAAYLNKLTGKISTINKAVLSAWNKSYRQTFVNASGVDRGSSLGELFNNTFLPYLEMHNREAKFGIPGGQRTGTPLPGNVEGRYSKAYSKDLALAAFNAYKSAWYGTGYETGQNGSSLHNYVLFMDRKSGTDIALSISTQFQAIEAKMNGLGSDFFTIANTSPSKLNEVWLAYQQLVITIKTEVSSALSITISYTDTDGD